MKLSFFLSLFVFYFLLVWHSYPKDLEVYNFSARYYDSKLARFISADPVIPDPNHSQAFNRYAYVYNNPLKLVDSTGNTPNYPNSPAASSFSLVLPEADSSESNPLNMRLDFDASGVPIHNFSSPVYLDENGNGILIGSRTIQAAAFGTREALRLAFAPIDLQISKAADLLILPFDAADRIEMYEELAKKYGAYIFTDDTSATMGVTVTESRSGRNFVSVLTQHHVQNAGRIGFNEMSRAGVSQTPVMVSITNPETLGWTEYARQGLQYYGSLPAGLSMLGGGFGIYSGFKSESPIAQGLGISGGALELIGGFKYLRSTYLIGSASFSGGLAGTSATFSALSGVRFMRVGGVLGLLTIPVELAYRDGALTKESMIPRYTLEEAIDNRAEAQGYFPKEEEIDQSHPYRGSTR